LLVEFEAVRAASSAASPSATARPGVLSAASAAPASVSPTSEATNGRILRDIGFSFWRETAISMMPALAAWFRAEARTALVSRTARRPCRTSKAYPPLEEPYETGPAVVTQRPAPRAA